MSDGVSFNFEGARRRLNAIRRGSVPAQDAVLQNMLGAVITQVEATAPSDTNRYRAGWARAANAAGVGPIRVPPLKASKYAQANRKLLEYRRDYIVRLMRRWYGSEFSPTKKGRHEDKWWFELMRALETVEQQLAQFDDTTLIIGSRPGVKKLSSWVNIARFRVYGGTGQRLQRGSSVYYTLRNREPHSSIVESRNKNLASAMRDFRALGLRRQSRAFTKLLVGAA